ncbi:MAG: hypothetical protein ACLPZR_14400, partial [Solirubrobacteraceae bacterium]
NTVDAYRSDLHQFGAFLADRRLTRSRSSTPSWPRSSTSWPTAGRARHRSRQLRLVDERG